MHNCLKTRHQTHWKVAKQPETLSHKATETRIWQNEKFLSVLRTSNENPTKDIRTAKRHLTESNSSPYIRWKWSSERIWANKLSRARSDHYDVTPWLPNLRPDWTNLTCYDLEGDRSKSPENSIRYESWMRPQLLCAREVKNGQLPFVTNTLLCRFNIYRNSQFS